MRGLPRLLVRSVLWLTVAFAGVIALSLGWIFLRYPRVAPAPQLAPASAGDVERGRYLFEQVLLCHNCHSQRDWRFYAGPVIPGSAGGGAWVEDRVVPAFSANLTPYSLAGWTDGEIFRAITSGVNRLGKPLHPLMPADSYRHMGVADVRAVVAYLRTLPPVAGDKPPWRARTIKEFLVVRVVGRLLPKPYQPVATPSSSDRVAYGHYLEQIAECSFCHGGDFSGGRAIAVPQNSWVAISSNITPDRETGIGTWTEDNFVNVFRSFVPLVENPVVAKEKNTVMPWLRYAAMTDGDLRALYQYLRTVPAVKKAEPLSPSPGMAR